MSVPTREEAQQLLAEHVKDEYQRYYAAYAFDPEGHNIEAVFDDFSSATTNCAIVNSLLFTRVRRSD